MSACMSGTRGSGVLSSTGDVLSNFNHPLVQVMTCFRIKL